uniref:Uncharacterized protein n=1 Tax=Paramormyrops kingsleyae TaxID=1676925 RepID=A0A3B3R2P7_9TELE
MNCEISSAEHDLFTISTPCNCLAETPEHIGHVFLHLKRRESIIGGSIVLQGHLPFKNDTANYAINVF